jgi:hypothetical protein
VPFPAKVISVDLRTPLARVTVNQPAVQGSGNATAAVTSGPESDRAEKTMLRASR